MKPKIEIGIDPGSQSGHYALMSEAGGSWIVEVIPFRSLTLAELFQAMKRLSDSLDCEAVCESVHGYPGMNTVAVSSLMKNFGHIEMVLAAAQIPTRYVTPQTWMKHFGVKKGKDESKTAWKKRLREVLQQRLPNVKCTVEQADAVLIALYGRETR